LLGHARGLPGRVRAARAQDTTPVRLADGSSLDVDTAERRLADKEERRAFAPLRDAIEDAAEEARDDEAAQEREVEDFVAGEVGRRWPDVDEDDARALLDAVTPAFTEVATAAAAAAFVDAPDAAAWARALDAPAGPAFAPDAVRALVRAALAAAEGPPVRAVSAPRALAGWVAQLPDGARAAVVPGLGAGRARRTLTAAGRALALGLSHATVGTADEGALGEAVGAALSGAAVRRAVLDSERRQAEAAQRATAVAHALRLALRAAAARTLLDGGEVEDAAESARQAAGARLSDATVHELLRLPFPEGGRGRTRLGGLLAELGQAALGAALGRRLREELDEDWPVRAASWQALRARSAEERAAALPDPAEGARAFIAAASELL
jgi:hypothetical protein